MDKTKLSICITGLLMCAMSYANISGNRSDARLQEADTLALTYVNVAPEAITAPAAKPKRAPRKKAETAEAEEKPKPKRAPRKKAEPKASADKPKTTPKKKMEDS